MSKRERRELPGGGHLDFYPAFLGRAEGDALLSDVLRDLAWEAREIVLFGKRILQPRLVAWAGTVPYHYTGQTLPPRAFSGALSDALARVVAETRVDFNHVLGNRYRDGRDGMGMHADDEPELGPNPVVATLSLGVSRRFVIAPRRGKQGRLEYALSHGSLLVMGGTCQETHRHGVPKDPRVAGERVSLTFRKILPPGG